MAFDVESASSEEANESMTATSWQEGRIKRVAVIGAGASGVAALRELTPRFEHVVCFEARKQVGGAWIYSEEPPDECVVSFDAQGRPFVKTAREKSNPNWPTVMEPSPMYRLRTNIPADGMSYRGVPFEDTSSEFPRDDEVVKYIQDCAKDYVQHIRFGCVVRKICKQLSGGWLLQYQPSSSLDDSATLKEEVFDAILDASGHYTVPYIPRIEGLWNFKGTILHAKWYRQPETFANQNVLVVGNRASGSDIGRQIASMHANANSECKVYQSVRSPFSLGIDPREGTRWSSHLHIVSSVESATAGSIATVDGTVLEEIDTIIFATGYLYAFPYHDSHESPFAEFPLVRAPEVKQGTTDGGLKAPRTNDGIYPEGGLQVHNVDTDYQTFYRDPTLAFSCLNKSVIPFPLAQIQAHAIAKVWSGQPIELRWDTITEEDYNYHTYGNPREFDVEDALLNAIGEGRHCSPRQTGHASNGVHDDDEPEILSDGRFPLVSSRRREERGRMVAKRRQVLGY